VVATNGWWRKDGGYMSGGKSGWVGGGKVVWVGDGVNMVVGCVPEEAKACN
jgi:hypothetical protein